MLVRVWRKGNSPTLLVVLQIVTAAMEDSMGVPQKLKIEVSYDPAIPPLGIWPRKTLIKKNICISMFIAALFTRAKAWNQLKCPLIEEWIKISVCIHTRK